MARVAYGMMVLVALVVIAASSMVGNGVAVFESERNRILSERTLFDKIAHPLESDRQYLDRVAPGLGIMIRSMDLQWK